MLTKASYFSARTGEHEQSTGPEVRTKVAMEPDVFVVSDTPELARCVQCWLREKSSSRRSCHTLSDLASGHRGAIPGFCLLVLAPMMPETLARWLSLAQAIFPDSHWMIVAKFNIVTMFLSALECQVCTIASPNAPPKDLRESLAALQSGVALRPPSAMQKVFTRGASLLRDGTNLPALTRTELQCGAAVSLELNDRAIAHALNLEDVAVESTVHDLMRKLMVSDREALGAFFDRAFELSDDCFHHAIDRTAEW